MGRPNPKSLFIKLEKDAATRIGTVVEEGWFQKATSATMAQMAESGATQEQLLGARMFLDMLTSIHVEIEPQQPFPDKSQLKAMESAPETEEPSQTQET